MAPPETCRVVHGTQKILPPHAGYSSAFDLMGDMLDMHNDVELHLREWVIRHRVLLYLLFRDDVIVALNPCFVVTNCGLTLFCVAYLIAEYAYTLKVDEKSDVYSFGVVLLELITGRRPVGEFGDGVDIVQWAKRVTDCSRDNVAAIADPRLSTVPIAEAMHVFFVAMLCVQENSVERPTMREVVQMLSEFPHHVPETHSPSSSAAALKESSSGKKETGFCKLFPDLLT
ncbi:hypothetical protein BHE74_00008455 [Ensete ventricosum]|nr:hypothetical protein GW17_00005123 [Ensete ventricosum]RWW83051.1 hypothetical protein BHE74_00008455 [Ensete ventricosum]RZR93485.1 hypothetical protein BHM03_00022000 [Ensete ventricosum]